MRESEFNPDGVSFMEEGYDFVLPIEAGGDLKSHTSNDEMKEQLEIMMVYPKKARVLSKGKVNNLIQEFKEVFHQKMTYLLNDLTEHNKTLVDQFSELEPQEEFVKIEINGQKGVDRVTDLSTKTSTIKLDGSINDETKSEMKSRMEDLMRCSNKERFNSHERSSTSFSIDLNEEVGVEGNYLVSMWTDDIKEILNDWNDEYIEKMESLVKEIKLSNKMLFEVVSQAGKEKIQNLNSTQKVDYAVQVREGLTGHHYLEKEEEFEMKNEIFNIIEDIWEPDYPAGEVAEDIEIIESPGKESNNIMDDFMTLSFKWHEGITHSDAKNEVSTENTSTEHSCDSFPLYRQCFQDKYFENPCDSLGGTQSQSMEHNCESYPLCQACTSKSEKHTCDSFPLCLTCTQNRYAAIETKIRQDLQLNDYQEKNFCNTSPLFCAVHKPIEEKMDGQGSVKSCEIEKIGFDIAHPPKWPPLKLTLAEKVRYMEDQRNEPFLAELESQWTRMNIRLKKMVDELDSGLGDFSEFSMPKKNRASNAKLPYWLEETIDEEEEINFIWMNEMQNIKMRRQKEVMDAMSAISFNQRFITMAYALKE